MASEQPTTSAEYRQISRFPGYLFGDDGTVWSRWKHSSAMGDEWRQRKLFRRQDGYLSIRFGANRSYLVHQLVLEAFVGPRPGGMECRHLNGIPDDNRLLNLSWGTKSENNRDSVVHGTNVMARRGELHPAAKLTDRQRNDIRALRLDGFTFRKIAERVGTTKETVAAIISGRVSGKGRTP